MGDRPQKSIQGSFWGGDCDYFCYPRKHTSSSKSPKAHKHQKARRKPRVRVKERYKTRRLGAGPGVSGSVGSPGDGSGAVLGAKRRNLGLKKTMDLGAIVISSWAPDCNVFLLLSRVFIYSFAIWSARSHVPRGLFLGSRSL